MKGGFPESGSEFPKNLRIGSLSTSGKGGGPAFVGQVYSMCDVSGNGLIAVTNHFDIPFISKRSELCLSFCVLAELLLVFDDLFEFKNI